MDQPCAQLGDVRTDRWGRVCSTVMRNPAISPAAKAVYSALTTYADRDGHACVSHDRLASELGRSRSWVCGAFGELATAGVIEINHRFAFGRQLPSTYRIRDGQTRKASRSSSSGGRTGGRETVGEPGGGESAGETGPEPDGQEPSGGGVSGGDIGACPESNAGVSPADTIQDGVSYLSLSFGRERANFFDKLMGHGRDAGEGHAPTPESQNGPTDNLTDRPAKPAPSETGAVPADWRPTPDDIAWAQARIAGLDAARFTECFVLSCRAKGYRYTDISSAWRRWLNEPKGRLPMLNQSPRDIRHDRTSEHAFGSTSGKTSGGIGSRPGPGQRRAASPTDSRTELNRRNDAKSANCLERIMARRAAAACAGSPG